MVLITKTEVDLQPNSIVKPCKKCGNNTKFTFCSTKITNAYYQLYLVCQCGYDPTEYNHQARGEDVPDDIASDRLTVALWYWNRAIEVEGYKH